MKVTEKQKKAFIAHLAKTGIVADAAKAGGHPRQHWYLVKKNDEEFSAAWDDAMEVATDLLEKEARRRAEKGTKRPIYQGGKLVGHEQQYSDQLMALLLKGYRRSRFSERVEHDLSDKAATTITDIVRRAAQAKKA